MVHMYIMCDAAMAALYKQYNWLIRYLLNYKQLLAML